VGESTSAKSRAIHRMPIGTGAFPEFADPSDLARNLGREFAGWIRLGLSMGAASQAQCHNFRWVRDRTLLIFPPMV
jgi:hypothetical protein